jgi:hypothetical protein
MSIEHALELFDYYRAQPGQPGMCSACGHAGKSGYASPTPEEVRAQREQLPTWTADQIAQEMARLNALGRIQLCDDCWHLGYGWAPGEAHRLHRLAYRRRNMTRAEFDRKVAKGTAIYERRQHKAKPVQGESWRFVLWKGRPVDTLDLLYPVRSLTFPEQSV